MKNPFRMNKIFHPLIIAASLPLIIQTASAQIFLSDDFVVTPNNGANDANTDITDGRQGGMDAVSDYVNYDQGNAWNHQTGNTGTEVGQPPYDGNYLLLAQFGAVQNNLNISTTATGPLAISFNLYETGSSGASTYWEAFTLQAAGTYPFPIVNGGEFGFLSRKSGGIHLWDGAGDITPAGWDTAGFATNSYWTLIFSDSSGAGSAFNGNGSQVTIKNGAYTLGTFTLPQLNTSDIEAGFRADDEGDPGNLLIAGVDNLSVASSAPAAWLPVVAQDISPDSATVAVGGSVVFTASFSNSPPVSLQWQDVDSGSPVLVSGANGSPVATNDINTGVVNVTNNGVVTSTLTLNNVQPFDPSNSIVSIRLEAINATNSTAVDYSTPAPLTVVPEITWYASGAGNGVFSSNSVLGFAGSPGNEVYGVDFGGSGGVTTGNGYTFNDYAASGNMSMYENGNGLTSFTGYELGSVTTGDSGLDTILNYGVTGSAVNTAVLNNLTIGQAYTVLVLMDDSRTSGAGGPNFDVTDGLTVSPAQAYAFPNGTPAVGGFIMGKFTATATTQPLTVLEDGNAQYIAVLLEKGTAPAPVVAPTLTQDVIPLVSQLYPGSPVTLSVVAAGSPPLSYQWSNGSGPISGATNASYSFDAPAGASSYNTNSYYWTVTNAANGVISSTAEVISSTNIVSVYNYSFEDGTYGSGNLVFPVDWTAFNNNNFSTVAMGDSGYSGSLPDGNFFYAVNEGPSDPTGGIYQDVGALQPNTTYTLTVAIGLNENFTPGNLGSPGIISLINGTNDTGTLLATTNGVPSVPNTWQDYTVTFVTGSSVSGDLTVELSVAGASTYQAEFDNVRLTQGPPTVLAPTLLTDISPLESRLTTGTPVTFVVAVNGNPLNYQWYNQNGAINGAISTSYSFNSLAGTNSYYVIVTNTAGVVTSSTATVVSAQNIVTVNNFSFLNQVLIPGETYPPGGGTAPTGWTGFNVGSGGNYDYGITYSGSGTDFTTPLTAPAIGNNYLWVNRFGGNGTQVAGVYQNVGSLLPNTTYTLTVAIGQRGDTGPDGSWSPGIISLINGTDNTGILLATGGGLPATADTWQDYTASFTTGASVTGDLTIELSVLDAPSIQGDFSNVELTQAPLLVFNPPTVSGGNLILTGVGGTANSGYTLLTTTNLLSPWTTNSIGTFSGTGGFSNSIPIGTGSASFFRLRTP
jgi:hypothetical protein